MENPEAPPKDVPSEKREDVVDEKREGASTPSEEASEIDIYTIHEERAGRLVIDPAEARAEFGEKIAAKLKLNEDGTKVLWPQPTDDPEDPLNWSWGQKHLMMLIITMAAIVPDFDSGIGIASIFGLAVQYNTTTGEINNLTSNWSIFLLGWGGLFAVMIIRRYGRLPVLFWSQFVGLAFLIGCAVAPNLNTFTAMRCITGFFSTAPQVTGLYVVTDMFPFHLQARKLNLWTMGFLISPFLSPFAFGFLVARTTWRWAYGIGCMYSFIVVMMIVLFGRETMYDRHLKPIPKPDARGLRLKIETLIGITGYKLSKYRSSWYNAVMSPLRVVWRPHLALVLLYEAMIFGFSIGINVTNVVFVQAPPPLGYAFGPFAIAGSYGTPIVAVLLGEVFGRYVNDFIADLGIRRNKGVFFAEIRLWTTYLALPMFVVGMILLGASFQKHLPIPLLIIGWGLAEMGVMVNTVAIYAYANDCFPRHQGEISALINLSRTLGGFAIAYYQVPWASKNGALQTFGCEAAIVVGLFILIIPAVQIYGQRLREKFSPS